MRSLGAMILAALVVLPLTPAEAFERLRVVATFSILADMVRVVGGERVEVTDLVGPNSDAHAFQPTPADSRALTSAHLVVVNGLAFEGWLDRLVRASGLHGPIAVASAGLEPLMVAAGQSAVADPHAWQDVANAIVYVRNITHALVTAAPASEAIFRANAETYAARLRALDEDIRRQIAELSPAQRRVITSHDAFAYFGRAYGIEFKAAAGISSDSEPTPRDVARLIDQIRRSATRAIFVENMGDPRLIGQIARDAGATVGGKLYADSLSTTPGEADTYENMIRHNVAALIKGMRAN
ncbi:MAG: metal ABC transporter substrate-binding protein [Alphaproteobacteria bacterium]|nr:metal ABC transporter substrate-binding protein [Alphaproteobacteria bacterium]